MWYPFTSRPPTPPTLGGTVDDLPQNWGPGGEGSERLQNVRMAGWYFVGTVCNRTLSGRPPCTVINRTYSPGFWLRFRIMLRSW